MKLLQICLKVVKTCTRDISIQCSDNLSMQGINRTLLSWLKLWDECVFGRSSLPVGGGKGGPGKKKGEEKGQPKGAQGKNFEKKVEYKDPSALAGPEVRLYVCVSIQCVSG